jgi:hypothetical protein
MSTCWLFSDCSSKRMARAPSALRPQNVWRAPLQLSAAHATSASSRGVQSPIVALGGAAASADGVLTVSLCRAAKASRSLRRWPTIDTPRSLRSSAVRFGRTVSSISRNAASYFPMHAVQQVVEPVDGPQRERVDPTVGHPPKLVDFLPRVRQQRDELVDERCHRSGSPLLL